MRIQENGLKNNQTFLVLYKISKVLETEIIISP